jgi:uncharacterized membrane protein
VHVFFIHSALNTSSEETGLEGWQIALIVLGIIALIFIIVIVILYILFVRKQKLREKDDLEAPLKGIHPFFCSYIFRIYSTNVANMTLS